MNPFLKLLVISTAPAAILAGAIGADTPARAGTDPATQPSTQPATQPQPILPPPPMGGAVRGRRG